MYSLSKANKVLPTIILKNNQYARQIKNKIQASYIFFEFDKKASNELMNMVKLSNKRNRDMKTGSLLETVLSKSNDTSAKVSSKIVNDPLFVNINSFREDKKKLKKNITKQYEDEVSELIKQMEQTGKIDYLIDNKKKTTLEEETIKNSFDTLPKEEKRIRGNQIISSQILSEKEQFNKSVNTYLSKINGLYNNYYEKIKDDEVNIKNAKNELIYKKKKLPVATYTKIGLLSYRKPAKIVSINKSQSTGDLFEIKKMLPYTKLGVLAKKKSEKRYKRQGELTNKGNLRKSSSFSSSQMEKVLSILNEDNSSIDDMDYSNTANIVLKQAVKNFTLEDKFISKSQYINYLLDQDLPNLEEYNKIIKSKVTQMKLNRKTNLILNNNTTSDNTSKNSNEVSNQETQLENTFTKIKSSRIKEEIKALIEGSKKEGRSESIEIDNKNKKENPLTFISSIPARVVDKFCDGYSVRDGSCNKILDKLVTFFGKRQYSTKEIAERINSYMDLVNHQNERKKKKLHEKYIETLNSVESKIMADKIRLNLNSPGRNEEETSHLHNNKSCINIGNSYNNNNENILNETKNRRSESTSRIGNSSNNESSNMNVNNSSLHYDEFLEQRKLVEKKLKKLKKINGDYSNSSLNI